MKCAPIVRVTRISRSPSKKSHSTQSKLTSETQHISTQSPDRNNNGRISITKFLLCSRRLAEHTSTFDSSLNGVTPVVIIVNVPHTFANIGQCPHDFRQLAKVRWTFASAPFGLSPIIGESHIGEELTYSPSTKQQRISGVSVQRTINVSITEDNSLNQKTRDVSAASHTASARNYSGVSIQRLPTAAIIRERLSNPLPPIEISETESPRSKSSLPAGVHVERILNERRRRHRVNVGSASSENSNESELNKIRRFSGAHVGPSPTTMEESDLPYKSLSMDSINQSDPATPFQVLPKTKTETTTVTTTTSTTATTTTTTTSTSTTSTTTTST
ncbi:unnamed protein product, partial [Rotaria magnacalcarata]